MTTVRLSPCVSFLLTAAAVAACGPSVELPQGDSTTNADGSTGTPATSSAPGSTSGTNPTTPPDPPQTSTDPYVPTTGSSGGSTSGDTDDGCGFLQDCGPDTGITIECDIFEQNCSEGEKCAPWANDGGSAWNATRCVPVARDAGLPGDPCTALGSSTSGIDDCALGSMCWNVDPETLGGQCIAQCGGSEANPTCDGAMESCQMSSGGVLNLCIPECDPITQADCADGEGCYPISDSFFCVPDASGDGGAPFEECEFLNGCEPGTACAAPTASDACSPDASGCCLPWCDLNLPDCPGDMVCTPWFEEGQVPKGSEFVGLCVDESAAP